MSAVRQLLLLALRPPAAEGSAPARARGLTARLDWAELVRAAEAEQLLPALAAGFPRWGIVPPIGVASRLAEAARVATARSLLLGAQLGEALDALAGAGVDALAFKGPVLAADVYPAPHLRLAADLDLLVPPAAVERATEALGPLGYAPAAPWPPGCAACCLAAGKERPLVAPDRATIDLHWRLTRPGLPLSAVEPALWGGRRTVTVAGRPVPTLGREEALVHLCVHGARHGWDLRRVSDVGHAVAADPPPDWTAAGAFARAGGAARALAAGVGLARELLGVRPPGAPAPDPVARALVAHHARALRRGVRPGPLAEGLARLALRDGVRDRARELGAALDPAEADWELVDLPPRLFGLYRGIRLGRLAAGCLRRGE